MPGPSALQPKGATPRFSLVRIPVHFSSLSPSTGRPPAPPRSPGIYLFPSCYFKRLTKISSPAPCSTRPSTAAPRKTSTTQAAPVLPTTPFTSTPSSPRDRDTGAFTTLAPARGSHHQTHDTQSPPGRSYPANPDSYFFPVLLQRSRLYKVRALAFYQQTNLRVGKVRGIRSLKLGQTLVWEKSVYSTSDISIPSNGYQRKFLAPSHLCTEAPSPPPKPTRARP